MAKKASAKEKDPRFEVVKLMLQKKKITTFADIFKYIPHTVVAGAMGKNNNAMRDLIAKPGRMKLEELFRLADLFKYDRRKMVSLIAESYKPE